MVRFLQWMFSFTHREDGDYICKWPIAGDCCVICDNNNFLVVFVIFHQFLCQVYNQFCLCLDVCQEICHIFYVRTGMRSKELTTQAERYVCLLYRSTDSKSETLKELRWALFAKAGKEGRQLPPTLGTLIPHTKRTYYHALVLKKSTMPCPVIPSPTNFSWIEKDGCLQPQQCTLPPTPEALVALRKCGCSKGCKTASCGCKKFRICHARIYATVEKVVTIGMIIPLRTSIY